MKGRRTLTSGLLVGGLLAAGVVVYELQPEAGNWVKVERRDLVVGVEVEGELRAVDSASLGPPQLQSTRDFQIAWMAPESTEVSLGQPVLRFDTTQLRRQLLEQMAEHQSAIKNLEKKETDLKIEHREMELQVANSEADLRKSLLKLQVPEAATARAELEKARIDKGLAELEIKALTSKLRYLEERSRSDLKVYRERRDRAGRRVEALKADIESMTVKATRAGTLVYIARRGRPKKKVGDSVWRAEKIQEIPDLARMMAEGEVAEAHIGRVAVGQPVTFRLDAYPDQKYSGKVKSIRRAVQKKSRRNPVKIVKLEVEIEATDTERMRPGMRFRGRIEIERVVDTLVVPKESVFPRSGGAVVFVRTFGGRREVVPTFGAHNQEEFGVRDGLNEGDWILRRDDEEGS